MLEKEKIEERKEVQGIINRDVQRTLKCFIFMRGKEVEEEKRKKRTKRISKR